MKKRMSFVIWLLCAWLFLQPVAAQQPNDTISNYSCDFEDAVENSRWNLAIGDDAATIPNKWYIGHTLNNGGQNGLYVSDSLGLKATYTPSSCVILASRKLILLKTGLDYTLSFDWLANGFLEGGEDGLLVAWVPETDYYGDKIYDNLKSVSNAVLDPDNLKPYCLELNPTAVSADDRLMLRNAASWRTCEVTIPKGRTGKAYYLVIGWRNGAGGVGNPPAAIDNIAIIDGRACPKPLDFQALTVGEDSLVLNWQGEEGARYEVGCYSYETKQWKINVVDTTSYVYTKLPEGYCDFYVRTVCYDEVNQQEYYSGKVMSSIFLYYPDRHCIDYISMSDDNCYTNTEDTKVSKTNSIDLVKWQKGMVVSEDPKLSRHTLITSKVETDPNTNGLLKVVPEGEIASVRLGNWNTGGEAEMVEFKFHVNVEVNPILVMKYAVVLQHPGDACKPNPGFRLRVLRKGKKIENTCTALDFDYKSAADKEWNMYQPASGPDVRWKDWTTVGVNLAEYDGETLTIQLTTYDCGGGGHYGYAYFVLGCAKDQLEGLNCDGTESNDFYAPPGFNYKWYIASDPHKKTVGTEQHLYVSTQDTMRYAVDVQSKEDSTCYFTLYATSQPRKPVPKFAWTLTQKDCKNMVSFTNKSYVEVYNTVSRRPSHLPCSFTEMEINGKVYPELTTELQYPNEGGAFPVTVRAGLENCMAEITDTIKIPYLGPRDTTLHFEACTGYPFTFNDSIYYETGTYEQHLLTHTGCDSIIHVDILFRDTLFTTLDTMILSGQSILFNDTLRTETGVYVHHTSSQYGCDSIATLNLMVHQVLKVEYEKKIVTCADVTYIELPYTIKQGITDTYSLKWQGAPKGLVNVEEEKLPTDSRLVIPVLQPIEANVYEGVLTFYDNGAKINPTIPNFVDSLTLVVQYADSVLTQRWNDVLAVKNSEYNGGYTFSAYQWYKDGKAIEGATASILYVPEGLDFNAAYTVALTREKDNVTLYSCPIKPEKVSGINDVPTLVPRNTPLQMQGKGTARWFTALGTVLSEQTYDDSPIMTPATGGSFVLQLNAADTNIPRAYHIVVW